MSNNFRIGQKVVCVDDRSGEGCWYDDEAVVEGRIYTVSSIHRDHDGDVVLWLEEVSRAQESRALWGPRCGYWVTRFRPAVDKPCDISIFKKMLTPSDEKVEA